MNKYILENTTFNIEETSRYSESEILEDSIKPEARFYQGYVDASYDYLDNKVKKEQELSLFDEFYVKGYKYSLEYSLKEERHNRLLNKYYEYKNSMNNNK